MTPLRVAIVVLNWNSAQDTIECLASVSRSGGSCFTTVVADNGSTDGSLATIAVRYPGVELLKTPSNLGYAGGNNKAVHALKEEEFQWFLLLNPDTTLASRCLTDLLAVAESDPSIAVVGPTIYHASEPNTIQSAGGVIGQAGVLVHRGANEVDRGQYAYPEDVDWVSGCALMVRGRAFAALQGFDERFFMYGEEVDLCARARGAGYRIVHVPAAKVWHKGVSRTYNPPPYVTYYSTRNQFLFLGKNFRGGRRVCAIAAAWARETRTLAAHSIKPRYRHLRYHRNARALALVDVLRRRWGQKVAPPAWFFTR